ncbi:MAG TPA: hypothetical protein VJX67_26720, partial [Blastocatellia bacterium]|nr:hypothetical protein [Blastocatellia bacterium]
MATEFEAKLHRQIEELVSARVGPLEQDISRLQREVNQAFTTLLERTDSATTIPETDQAVGRIVAEVDGAIGKASADS